MVDLSSYIAKLSPSNRKLLTSLLKEKGSQFNVFQLSFAQQRLWFLHQLEPDSPAYNIAAAVSLTGRLDLSALERALNEVVCRHESLRTVFVAINGEPMQVVKQAQEIRLSAIDLRSYSEPEREAEVSRRAREAALTPFNLEQGPLLRVRLLHLQEDMHVLLFTMHHIISDAWSMELLIRDVNALYEAFSKGLTSPLPEPAVQYTDFASWQRNWLQADVLEELTSYWQQKLQGAPAKLDLATDRPRPAVQTQRGGYTPINIPPGISKSFKDLVQTEGATPFMGLLAVFNLMLYRQTGQADLVVGTLSANRNSVEVENIIGLFVNTLLLRTQLSGDTSFRHLLRQVRENTLEAYAHQDMPFDLLVDVLQPERQLSHSPLFQVVFTLNGGNFGQSHFTDLSFNPVEVQTGTAKFDMTLALVNTTDGFKGAIEYNRDLFDADTISRMVTHLEVLLKGVVRNPYLPISELLFLSESEIHQLVVEWNEAPLEHRAATCIHHAVEQHAKRSPDAVALVCGQDQLSYGELNRRANELADYLRSIGATVDSKVTVCVEPSFDLVVAMLGVLKAGAAYVPLDPAYPRERLEFILQDAQSAILVTQSSLFPTLLQNGVRVICLDTEREGLSECSRENPASLLTPDNLAYVIYTSGSTGKPKGVMVTHSNVTRLFAATEAKFGFDDRDTWTLFHSCAFDFSVWEIWGALLYGGRLVIVPYLKSRSPEEFYKLVCQEEVTVLNQTPTAFRQLMEAEKSFATGEPLQLRLVIFGGEALELRSLDQWLAVHGNEWPQLVNMYGITETTIHVTYRRIVEEDLARPEQSLLGRPVSDMRAYVLDGHQQLVAVGVPGEIYVGGKGLARGYLNNPALTAERFIPDPFCATAGERLYRTGDLARFRADGDIEYIGRVDEQVKIRGYRIELGEIEKTLEQHTHVKQSVVLAREDAMGKRLVAYIVADDERDEFTSELRRFLREKLPAYMIPASFVILHQMPLTANGKIDRRALPEPGLLPSQVGSTYVAPRTPEEEVLTAIWAQVLGVERVGIDDNLFALGGDSILTIRIVALARERGLSLSVQQLFLHPNVRNLASEVHNSKEIPVSPKSAEPFSLISDEDRTKLPNVEDAYPLTRLQAGMLYHMYYRPNVIVYHNIYSYHLKTRFDLRSFHDALSLVVARHPVMRTSFDLATYSEPLQLVHKQADIPLEVADLRHLSAAEQDELLDAFLETEKQKHFDLSRPPLVRFHIHRRTDSTFEFWLSECHPLFDGWSLHSTLAEVFNNYFALINGEPLPEAQPSAIAASDYVHLERQAMTSEKARDFWAEKLSGFKRIEIPKSTESSPNIEGSRIGLIYTPIPDKVTVGLRQLAAATAVPFKSVLLAAYMKVLSIISGQSDVLAGLVINGRPEGLGGDRVLGLFFNVVPFRLDLSPDTWSDLVRATFDAEQEMFAYRRYPLSAIQNSLGGHPLFETLFNYLHFYVVRDTLLSGNLEILEGSRRWEETNFKLSIGFSSDIVTSQLTLVIRYDRTELAEQQVRDIVNYFENVLRAMTEDSDESHASRCHLTPDEQRRLTVEWNNSQREFLHCDSIHELFEAQVERSPEAVALVYEGEQLTYRELNERANQIAHHLMSIGVGPDSRIGILMSRSAQSVISMLGVIKAGGAYVPLDSEHPLERLTFMIKDAGMQALLGEQRLTRGLQVDGLRILCLDADGETFAQQSGENPPRRVCDSNLVYVIYTSGSTGRPKGVAVEHRQLLNYIHSIVERVDFPARARFALVSSLAADLGHTVIFPSLCTGGALHVLSQERTFDARSLSEYFKRHAIDCLKIVPSHLASLLASYPSEEMLPRHRLVLGGDVADYDLTSRIKSLAPECKVFNHYGPTETTVGVLAGAVEEAAPSRMSTTLPLGTPLPNTTAYILNRHLGLVPVGTPGELYVGGRALSRGYINHAEQTAESFIPDPFGHESGARLYKTGDLCRYLPDGKVEFIGRVDQQVKIRGFRVECGEIESALNRHESIRDVAVVAFAHEQGDKRVVAYVAPEPGQQVAAADLRTYLREFLPDFMIPSAFVLLDALPLTPNGKINRLALPEPDLTQGIARTYDAPQTDLEQLIAGVWKEVLHLEAIGVNQNFFDLGGHSLFMLQIHSKLRGVLNRNLSIVELFEFPTIRALAQHFGEQMVEPPADAVMPNRAESRRQSIARSQEHKRKA